MGIWVAMLRGINVGGHKIMKMADLAETFTAAGCDRVQTYIQSGNVLFDAAADAQMLRRRLETAIAARFGFDVPVILRTPADLARIIERCPYPAGDLGDGESLYVAMLAAAPLPAGAQRLLTFDAAPDAFRLVDRDIYLLYRRAPHKSTLTNNSCEQRLGVLATTRNWQTVSKLADLATAMER